MKAERETAVLQQRKTSLSPAKRALLEKWALGQETGDVACIPRRPPNSPPSLSFPQQRQLFLELLEPGTTVNNLSICLELTGKLNIAALEHSANQILVRHEVLRTRFDFGKGLPVPETLPNLIVALPIIDLQKFCATQREAEARRLAAAEVRQPFDLSQAPLLRLKLYRLDFERHFLLLLVHHTIGDGWSLGVFLRELLALYQAQAPGEAAQLPELPIQYADFVHWQREEMPGEILMKQLQYWKERLRGELPELELPLDHPRVARQTFSGGTHHFELATKLTEKLKTFSRQENVSLFMTLLAAFQVLLHRYSGQDDILVGTPVANRNRPELENLIGVFINTLVMRSDCSGGPNFIDMLKRVREAALAAYAHADLPFEKLVEELKPLRDLSHTPLFQVMFNLQNAPLPVLQIPGLTLRPLGIDRGVSQFDLTLIVTESEGRLRGTVEYNSDLFKAATIARMFNAYCLLLEDALAHPECSIARLQILTETEENRLRSELYRTQIDFPREACVHELFAAQAEQTPDAVAVIYENSSLTYRELEARANALARQLQALGLAPETRVGIFMERSLEIVVALFGVLKAGGAYVPISPSLPAERVRFVLNDANVRVLLTNIDASALGKHDALTLMLDETLLQNSSGAEIVRKAKADNLAYVIYTSGSTGQPKGVMISHRALVNFLWSMRQRPGIDKDDVLLAVTALAFDIAALELFLPLIAGATVVVASNAMATSARLIAQAIKRHGVSLMQATPATWRMLHDAGWPGEPKLKALCGGEAWTRTLAAALLERVGSLWNMYGPTETTVWSAAGEIKNDDAPITIGQPIGNTQLYVLDRDLQRVPFGVAGELHIGGEGLARGYLNQHERTVEKFIPDPFKLVPGARLYKTGDRARYLPNGDIEILGRLDHQVKVNGFRIELGEIESALGRHPGVRETVVVARAEASKEARLIAYFVPSQELVPESGELRHFLKALLPSYMIPSVFISLEAMPLTVSRKIDRRALPPPCATLQARNREFVAPSTPLERQLAALYMQVLNIDAVGSSDNFFDLGGGSIQILEIIVRAHECGLVLTPEMFFEYQSVAELAAKLEETPS